MAHHDADNEPTFAKRELIHNTFKEHAGACPEPVLDSIVDYLWADNSVSVSNIDAHVYVIRHAQSVYNQEFAKTGRDPLVRDAKLTAKGHSQTLQLNAALRKLELRPDLIVTSPLSRAIQTTMAAFDHFFSEYNKSASTAEADGSSSPSPTSASAALVPVEVCHHHSEFVDASCDVGRPPSVLAADFKHPALSFSHLPNPWFASSGVTFINSLRNRWAADIADPNDRSDPWAYAGLESRESQHKRVLEFKRFLSRKAADVRQRSNSRREQQRVACACTCA